jgi:hypothetical protein
VADEGDVVFHAGCPSCGAKARVVPAAGGPAAAGKRMD